MNSVFIDASTCNVLFKMGSKFCLALNYKDALDKLALDVQSLSPGYDLYITLWPRTKEEGDTLLNSLSIGGVPFYVLREELDAVLNYAMELPKVQNIFVCNAPAILTTVARVEKFEAILRYGERYVLLAAEDKLLKSMQVFKDRRAIDESLGPDFNCYGDSDLISTDVLKSAWPDLSDVRKEYLVQLAPMIAAYNSPYKVEITQLMRELSSSSVEEITEKHEIVEETPKAVKAVVTKKREPESSEVHREHYRIPKKAFDRLAFALATLSCVGFALTGFGLGVNSEDLNSVTDFWERQQNNFAQENVVLDSEIKTYKRGVHVAGETATLMDFAKNSQLPVTISTVEVTPEYTALTITCNSEETKDNYVGYLSGSYTIGSVNALSVLDGDNGTKSYEYSITLASGTES